MQPAALSPWGEVGPWLCVPVFRPVCPSIQLKSRYIRIIASLAL
ncbi:hypothetical protein HMPREF0262_01862 [Clostridium sp. ATCC 29733]|nr:hypothetical protein HMPREF0262_01862 [Clostridium sp. ATCC 29733]